MTKRKAEDDNVWFVLEEDGGLKSIVKSAKSVVHDEETIVYEDGVAQHENEEEVDDVEAVTSDQIATSVAYADDDGEYYEVYEEENGDDSNAVSADDSRSKLPAQYVVQNFENDTVDEQEPSKFGCGSSWTDDAVLAMLAQVEPLLGELKALPPQKHREIWDRIGESLVPHQHSGMDCLLKFRNMKRAYKKLLLRKARNFPIQWKFFDRMHSLLQAELPQASPKDDADSDRAGPSNADKKSKTENLHLSKFDRFLEYKQEILEEVKSQGVVVKRHLEEMALSNDRRERKENEIYTLLKTIVTEEEKKVDLFRKLLERL